MGCQGPDVEWHGSLSQKIQAGPEGSIQPQLLCDHSLGVLLYRVGTIHCHHRALEASGSSCRKGDSTYPAGRFLFLSSRPHRTRSRRYSLPFLSSQYHGHSRPSLFNKPLPGGRRNLTDGLQDQGGVQAAETEERAEPLAPSLYKLGCNKQPVFLNPRPRGNGL